MHGWAALLLVLNLMMRSWQLSLNPAATQGLTLPQRTAGCTQECSGLRRSAAGALLSRPGTLTGTPATTDLEPVHS